MSSVISQGGVGNDAQNWSIRASVMRTASLPGTAGKCANGS